MDPEEEEEQQEQNQDDADEQQSQVKEQPSSENHLTDPPQKAEGASVAVSETAQPSSQALVEESVESLTRLDSAAQATNTATMATTTTTAGTAPETPSESSVAHRKPTAASASSPRSTRRITPKAPTTTTRVQTRGKKLKLPPPTGEELEEPPLTARQALARRSSSVSSSTRGKQRRSNASGTSSLAADSGGGEDEADGKGGQGKLKSKSSRARPSRKAGKSASRRKAPPPQSPSNAEEGLPEGGVLAQAASQQTSRQPRASLQVRDLNQGRIVNPLLELPEPNVVPAMPPVNQFAAATPAASSSNESATSGGPLELSGNNTPAAVNGTTHHASELMPLQHIYQPIPDTYSIAYQARLLGFDVKPPPTNNSQNGLVPPPCPPPKTWHFCRDEQTMSYQVIPPLGRFQSQVWHNYQAAQQQQASSSSLLPKEDVVILDQQVDPLYQGLVVLPPPSPQAQAPSQQPAPLKVIGVGGGRSKPNSAQHQPLISLVTAAQQTRLTTAWTKARSTSVPSILEMAQSLLCKRRVSSIGLEGGGSREYWTQDVMDPQWACCTWAEYEARYPSAKVELAHSSVCGLVLLPRALPPRSQAERQEDGDDDDDQVGGVLGRTGAVGGGTHDTTMMVKPLVIVWYSFGWYHYQTQHAGLILQVLDITLPTHKSLFHDSKNFDMSKTLSFLDQTRVLLGLCLAMEHARVANVSYAMTDPTPAFLQDFMETFFRMVPAVVAPAVPEPFAPTPMEAAPAAAAAAVEQPQPQATTVVQQQQQQQQRDADAPPPTQVESTGGSDNPQVGGTASVARGEIGTEKSTIQGQQEPLAEAIATPASQQALQQANAAAATQQQQHAGNVASHSVAANAQPVSQPVANVANAANATSGQVAAAQTAQTAGPIPRAAAAASSATESPSAHVVEPTKTSRMVADLNKCSTRLALLVLQQVHLMGTAKWTVPKPPQEPQMPNQSAAAPPQQFRSIVRFPNENDARAMTNPNPGDRLKRPSTRKPSSSFTSAPQSTRQVVLALKVKFADAQGGNTPQQQRPLEVFRIEPSTRVEVARIQIPDVYEEPPLDILRTFAIQPEPAPETSDDEIVRMMKKYQKEVEFLERGVEPKARKLLDCVIQERLEFERSGAHQRAEEEKQLHSDFRRMQAERKQRQLEQQKQLEQDMDAVCSICGDGEVTPDNQILFCDTCDVPVHQLCYGVENVPAGDYHCIACRFLGRDKGGRKKYLNKNKRTCTPLPIVCELCPQKRGAFIRTAMRDKDPNGKWVHAVCAKWQGLNFVKKDKPDLVEDVTSLKATFRQENIKCDLCLGERGAMNKCGNADCEKWLHVTCARAVGTCEVYHGEDCHGDVPDSPWTLFCPEHSDIDPEEVPKNAVPVSKLIDLAKTFPPETIPEPEVVEKVPFNKATLEEQTRMLKDPEYEAALIHELTNNRFVGVRCEVCDQTWENAKDLVRCNQCREVICKECVFDTDGVTDVGRCLTCKSENAKKAQAAVAGEEEATGRPHCAACFCKHGPLRQCLANPVNAYKWRRNQQQYQKTLFSNAKWIHYLCGLWNPHVFFSPEEPDKLDLSNVVMSHGRNFTNEAHPCFVCGKKFGLKLRCDELGCCWKKDDNKEVPTFFHVTCARHAGLEVAQDDKVLEGSNEAVGHWYVKCYRHVGNDFNLRAKLEDLYEIEKNRIERKQRKDDKGMTFPDGAKVMNAAIVVVKILGWAWRWAEWWVDYNSSWEPLLEPDQKEEEMTAEELRKVDSTRESRCDDARKCRLVAFGAALRNRMYDEEDDFDREALDRALRAVLHTKSLVGPLEKAEIDFHADWLGRAYRSKSRLLFLGEDKIPVSDKGFCVNQKDQSPKFSIDPCKIPGKGETDNSGIFERVIDDVDDFLLTEMMEDPPKPAAVAKPAPEVAKQGGSGRLRDSNGKFVAKPPGEVKRKRGRPPRSSDGSDEISSPPPKRRGPGRPPKNPEPAEDAQLESPPPKRRGPGRPPSNNPRKRGRPPANAENPDTPAAATDVPVATARKRGRPPRNRPVQQDVDPTPGDGDVVDEAAVTTPTTESATDTGAEPKRKRGRPRKRPPRESPDAPAVPKEPPPGDEKEALDPTTAPSDPDDTPNNPPKRKRGRPPKNKGKAKESDVTETKRVSDGEKSENKSDEGTSANHEVVVTGETNARSEEDPPREKAIEQETEGSRDLPKLGSDQSSHPDSAGGGDAAEDNDDTPTQETEAGESPAAERECDPSLREKTGLGDGTDRIEQDKGDATAKTEPVAVTKAEPAAATKEAEPAAVVKKEEAKIPDPSSLKTDQESNSVPESLPGNAKVQIKSDSSHAKSASPDVENESTSDDGKPAAKAVVTKEEAKIPDPSSLKTDQESNSVPHDDHDESLLGNAKVQLKSDSPHAKSDSPDVENESKSDDGKPAAKVSNPSRESENAVIKVESEEKSVKSDGQNIENTGSKSDDDGFGFAELSDEDHSSLNETERNRSEGPDSDHDEAADEADTKVSARERSDPVARSAAVDEGQDAFRVKRRKRSNAERQDINKLFSVFHQKQREARRDSAAEDAAVSAEASRVKAAKPASTKPGSDENVAAANLNAYGAVKARKRSAVSYPGMLPVEDDLVLDESIRSSRKQSAAEPDDEIDEDAAEPDEEIDEDELPVESMVARRRRSPRHRERAARQKQQDNQESGPQNSEVGLDEGGEPLNAFDTVKRRKRTKTSHFPGMMVDGEEEPHHHVKRTRSRRKRSKSPEKTSPKAKDQSESRKEQEEDDEKEEEKEEEKEDNDDEKKPSSSNVKPPTVKAGESVRSRGRRSIGIGLKAKDKDGDTTNT